MGAVDEAEIDDQEVRAEEQAVVNEVRLAGRLAAEPRRLELPSGDPLVQLRLVVPRPPDEVARAEGRRPPTVDTIDVSCWPGATADLAGLLGAGDVVEVHGALRRRFFRTPGGVQSRYEVRAEEIEVLRLGEGGRDAATAAEGDPCPAGERSAP